MRIEELDQQTFELLYWYVEGFKEFSYSTNDKCWYVEKKLNGDYPITIVNMVLDEGSRLRNSIYGVPNGRTADFMLREMQEENIQLAWTPDKEYLLSYAAFPEIHASGKSLFEAYQRVRIKKELGDHLSWYDLENLNKTINRNKEKVVDFHE